MARPRKLPIMTPEERLNAALVPVEEQPYPLPEGWKWVRLGDICSFVGGGTPDKAKPEFWNGNIPWASVKDIKGMYLYETKDYITENGLENSAANVANPGELIVVTRIVPAKCIISKIKVAINQDLKIVKSKVNTNFLYFYFCRFEDSFIKKSSGTTVKGITIQKMSASVFPYPHLAEQQRIVDRIESFFARLDEAKAKAQAVLDTFEARRAAILHKAFSGELTAQWRREHGLTLDSWEQLTLNDIAEYKKGPFGSAITKSMFVPEGDDTYKVYEQGNAIRKTSDYGHYYIDKKKYNELKSFAVYEGDIIISCAGTIGEVYKLPSGSKHGIINQALMRVRVKENTNEKFFEYYFSEILITDVKDKAKGTAIKNIPPFKILKSLHIKLPQLLEQNTIVEMLDNFLFKERKAKDAAESVLRQIDLMKKPFSPRLFAASWDYS